MIDRYLLVAAGYAVRDSHVLLVYHKGFSLWVPPGGHVHGDEMFWEAAEREFLEETGLRAHALSAAPVIHPGDTNSTPQPVPFYMDVLREGFDRPAYVGYFYMGLHDAYGLLTPQASEVADVNWFAQGELAELATFDQVRSLATYALRHHPHACAQGRTTRG